MCLCTKFEVIWTNENKVTGKRSWRIFYYVIWEMGWGAFSFPPTRLPQYKCMEIFKTLNSRNFCIYWCIDLKLAYIFQNGVVYIVLKFCPKSRLFKFLMTSLQTINIHEDYPGEFCSNLKCINSHLSDLSF